MSTRDIFKDAADEIQYYRRSCDMRDLLIVHLMELLADNAIQVPRTVTFDNNKKVALNFTELINIEADHPFATMLTNISASFIDDDKQLFPLITHKTT